MKKIRDYADFPNTLSQPALRAIIAAGIANLKALSAYTEQEFLALHGVGPKAIVVLTPAMKAKGLAFRKS